MKFNFFMLMPDPPGDTPRQPADPSPSTSSPSEIDSTNNRVAARKGEEPEPAPTGGGIEPAEDENEE